MTALATTSDGVGSPVRLPPGSEGQGCSGLALVTCAGQRSVSFMYVYLGPSRSVALMAAPATEDRAEYAARVPRVECGPAREANTRSLSCHRCRGWLPRCTLSARTLVRLPVCSTSWPTPRRRSHARRAVMMPEELLARGDTEALSPAAWNGSWNGSPRNPMVLGAAAALSCGIGAGSGPKAWEHASRNA